MSNPWEWFSRITRHRYIKRRKCDGSRVQNDKVVEEKLGQDDKGATRLREEGSQRLRRLQEPDVEVFRRISRSNDSTITTAKPRSFPQNPIFDIGSGVYFFKKFTIPRLLIFLTVLFVFSLIFLVFL